MRETIKHIPILGSLIGRLYGALGRRIRPFPGSATYWNRRYDGGGNSGPGSYRELAEFKAGILNAFVAEKEVSSVIEYGSGDGNQLKLATYPSYVGFDVSPTAIARCEACFRGDETKRFALIQDYHGETAQLTLSLDVIYHLTEDDVYHSHMATLFESSTQFVVIYSSNYDAPQASHEKRRKFTPWVEAHASAWKLIQHIPHRHEFQGDSEEGSLSDFFVYEKL